MQEITWPGCDGHSPEVARSLPRYREERDEERRVRFRSRIIEYNRETVDGIARRYARDDKEAAVLAEAAANGIVEALDTWPLDSEVSWHAFAVGRMLACMRPSTQPGGRVASRAGRYATPADPEAAFPGEDRAFGGNRLYVDLVPARCWFTSAARCLELADWHLVRTEVYRRAGSVCEICGSTGKGGALEAHERWEYDEAAGAQRLRRLIALCWLCHRTTHFGVTQMKGDKWADLAFTHLVRVNGWPPDQGHRHIEDAFALWEARSERDWELDLSILEAIGVRVARPEVLGDRAGEARRGVRRDGHDPGQVYGLGRGDD